LAGSIVQDMNVILPLKRYFVKFVECSWSYSGRKEYKEKLNERKRLGSEEK
jgi:hypothetical protein